jgi:hypothetical protein
MVRRGTPPDHGKRGEYSCPSGKLHAEGHERPVNTAGVKCRRRQQTRQTESVHRPHHTVPFGHVRGSGNTLLHQLGVFAEEPHHSDAM